MQSRQQHTHPMPATKVTHLLLRASLCALLCLAASANAQPSVPANANAQLTAPATPPPEPSFMANARAMDALAKDVVDRGHIPGLAMAIVQDGKVLVMSGYGVVDAHGSEPVTTDTVFRLASLSKGFAATLASMLVHDGLLGWD